MFKREPLSITKLTPRHNKMLDYCIEGLQIKQIAEKLNMTPRMVGIVVNSGSFQHELALRRKAFADDHDEKLAETEISDAANILQQHAAAAAKQLVDGLRSPSESLAIRSAESILDRTGLVKITRQESPDKPIINISREDLILLRDTLKLEKSLVCKDNEQEQRHEIVSTQTISTDEKVKQ